MAREHSGGAPGTGEGLILIDLILEVCRTFSWSFSEVMAMPVQRFWSVVESINRRNEAREESIKDSPAGSMDLESLEKEYE